MSPFNFIEELKNTDKITGFNDLLKIMGVVYSIIPWTIDPYIKQICYEDMGLLYKKFKKIELGGWCGLNAEFLKWILEGYRRTDHNVRFRSYNYGLSCKLPTDVKPIFTHIGVLVEIDRMEFFIDPYFARYYIHSDGYPLQFKDLLYLISEHKFDRYRSVHLPLLKPVQRVDGTIEHVKPEQLLEEVFGYFYQQGLSDILNNTFGSDNPDNLMLIKIPD